MALPIEPICVAHHVLQTSAECAAWVSARIAQDALFWSRAQGIAAIAGLLGLVVTVLFALQANRTARRSSENQLRGWVKLTPRVSGNFIRSNDGCSLAIEVEIENIGGTPAVDVQLFARLYAKGDIGAEQQRFADGVAASRGEEYPCTLFTGERVSRHLPLEDGSHGVAEKGDSAMLSLLVGARYRTIFDRAAARPRLTVRIYDLSNGEGGLIRLDRAAGPGSLLLTTNILVPGVVT